MKEYNVKLDDTTAEIFETLVKITNEQMGIEVSVEDAMAEVITQFVQQNYMRYVQYVRSKGDKDENKSF